MKNLTTNTFILISLLCLYGCHKAVLSREHVEQYLEVCKNNGGTKSIVIHTGKRNSVEKVICNDGASFDTVTIYQIYNKQQ